MEREGGKEGWREGGREGEERIIMDIELVAGI